MPIGDWIREANERRREKLRQESYKQGYADAQAGKPPRYPGTANNPPQPKDNEPGRSE